MYIKLRENIIKKSDDKGTVLFDRMTKRFLDLNQYERNLLDSSSDKDVEIDYNKFERLLPFVYLFEKNVCVDELKVVNTKTIDAYKIMGLKVTSCTLQFTSECSENCGYCQKSNRKCNCNKWFGDNTLTETQSLKFLELMKDYGVNSVNITGGDPFLKADMLNVICKYCMDNHLKCSIYTNGTQITSGNIKKLLEVISTDSLSITLLVVSENTEYINRITSAIAVLEENKIPYRLKCLQNNSADPFLFPFKVDEYEYIYDECKEYKIDDKIQDDLKQINLYDPELRERYNSCKLGMFTLCNDGNISICLSKENRHIISSINSDTLRLDIAAFDYDKQYKKSGKCKDNCRFNFICSSCDNIRKFYGYCNGAQ